MAGGQSNHCSGLDGQSFLANQLGEPLSLSGDVVNTISLFTTPMAAVFNVQEVTQPLIKALFLRNWDVKDGDIKHLLQGIHMDDRRFKSIATRARNNCQ
jgi:hypothetical protein